MRNSIIVALAVAAGLAACTSKTTVVKPVTEVPAPAPPPTVVYVPPPVVYPTPTAGQISVNYSGPGSFELAQQKAAAYCGEHYGYSNARLLTDDRAGHATFACVQG